MRHNTGIEWTHVPGYQGETWNPIVGCSIASAGCTNCYAMRVAHNRLGRNPKTPHYAGTTEAVNGNPVWTGKLARASDATIRKPLSWKAPRAIFVNSMGDLFHEDMPAAWIDEVFEVMEACPRHIFIVLTKRAKRMRIYLRRWLDRFVEFEHEPGESVKTNIWLGVSVENQTAADERIPELLDTPAAVRFVSCEPLLEPLQFEHLNSVSFAGKYVGPSLKKIDWLIAGGESGPKARPANPDWIRHLRDQCQEAGTPFFFKQWGEWLPGEFGTPPNFHFQNGEWMDTNRLPDFNDPEVLKTWDDGDWILAQYPDCSPAIFKKVGKKAAGNMLDGVLHQAFPEIIGDANVAA